MRWMIDVYHWHVYQGCFFVHQDSGSLLLNAELCAMQSVVVSRVDWWRIFLTNSEEIHHNFSKLIRGNQTQCSFIAETSVLAMIRGLRQALTRIGCLHTFESDRKWRSLVLQRNGTCDHVCTTTINGCVASFQTV